MKNIISSVILAFLLFSFVSSNAQSTKNPNKKVTIGLLVDGAIIGQPLPEGVKYYPILIQGNFRFPLLRNESRNQLTIQFQPQVNPVIIRGIENTSAVELGVTFGLAYERLVKSENGIFYIGISISPHAISYETARQANGFIFSDNLHIGYHQILGNGKWMVSYQLKGRHLSNGGRQAPNNGINNLLVGVGISRMLGKN
ncbi:MAG: acyloxyacyl hydrolase [Chitinophagales bacterium]